MEREEIKLHGHTATYRREGWGPLVVLVHGITASSDTWLDVIEPLAERYTALAPGLSASATRSSRSVTAAPRAR